MQEWDEIKDLTMERPHVVLLGAGASKAAFPCGDANGRLIPLMNELPLIPELSAALKEAGINNDAGDFELLYSELATSENSRDVNLLHSMERILFEYFSSLRLPDNPTMYDHLVLSLRKKDCIATFNWDPFLFRSLQRCYRFAPTPRVLFLHGSVALGICDKHKPLMLGSIGGFCRKCKRELRPQKLLYPITKKNYSNDPVIRLQWEALRDYLNDAFVLTIFGKAVPTSDQDAIELLKSAWGKPLSRPYEQTEFIDVKSEEELERIWAPFIHTHHRDIYQGDDRFYQSWLCRHPRRTCEAVWAQTQENQSLDRAPFPRSVNWVDLHKFLFPRVFEEQKAL